MDEESDLADNEEDANEPYTRPQRDATTAIFKRRAHCPAKEWQLALSKAEAPAPRSSDL